MSKIYDGTVLLGVSLTEDYQTSLALPATPVKRLLLLNGCDADLRVKINDDELYLPKNLSIGLGDLEADFSFQPVVAVKHEGSAPTEGSFQAVGVGK